MVVVVVFFFCVTILRIWWWYYYVSVLLLLSTCTLPSTVRWVTSPGWPPCSWPGDSFVGSIPDWNTRIWIAPILWLTSQLVYFIIDCWPITCTPCIHFTCVCCYYLLEEDWIVAEFRQLARRSLFAFSFWGKKENRTIKSVFWQLKSTKYKLSTKYNCNYCNCVQNPNVMTITICTVQYTQLNRSTNIAPTIRTYMYVLCSRYLHNMVTQLPSIAATTNLDHSL